jgi:hypothetical protein
MNSTNSSSSSTGVAPSFVDAYIWDPPQSLWITAWASFNTAWVICFVYVIGITTARWCNGKPGRQNSRYAKFHVATCLLAAMTAGCFSIRDWMVNASNNDIFAHLPTQFILLRMPLVFVGAHIAVDAAWFRAMASDRYNAYKRTGRLATANANRTALKLRCCKCVVLFQYGLMNAFYLVWMALVILMTVFIVMIANERWNADSHRVFDTYFVLLVLWVVLALSARLLAVMWSIGCCGNYDTPSSTEWRQCRHFTFVAQLVLVCMLGFLSYAHVARQIHNDVEQDAEDICEDWTMRLNSMMHIIYFATAVAGFYLYGMPQSRPPSEKRPLLQPDNRATIVEMKTIEPLAQTSKP